MSAVLDRSEGTRTLIDDQLFSISKAARAFRLSKDTIRVRIKKAALEPKAKRHGHDVYDLGELARACFETTVVKEKVITKHLPAPPKPDPLRLASDADGKVDPERLPARMRKDWYDGEMRKIALAEKLGELVPIEAYREELARVLKDVALALEDLPSLLSREQNLPIETADRIQEIVDNLRLALVERLER